MAAVAGRGGIIAAGGVALLIKIRGEGADDVAVLRGFEWPASAVADGAMGDEIGSCCFLLSEMRGTG